MHFSTKCNSGRIAIQWFHIKHYLDYQYTKFQPYTFLPFGCKKCVFLHDTRLWFPDYVLFVSNGNRSILLMKSWYGRSYENGSAYLCFFLFILKLSIFTVGLSITRGLFIITILIIWSSLLMDNILRNMKTKAFRSIAL